MWPIAQQWLTSSKVILLEHGCYLDRQRELKGTKTVTAAKLLASYSTARGRGETQGIQEEDILAV